MGFETSADPRQQATKRRETGREKQGHHLLVAEDDPVGRFVIKQRLTGLGFSVDVVENGGQVLRALDRNYYDLVLMDCQMPEVDGYEATRRLRHAGKRLPVIALTAHDVPNVRQKCLDAGMDDYLAKADANNGLSAMLDAWLP